MRRIVAHMMLLLTWFCGSSAHACQDIPGNGLPNSGLQHPGRQMQDTLSFTLERSIPGDFTYMSTDILGNLYLISSGNRLMKRNANGDSVAVFNEVRKYGNPSDIDVSNPMKVIVYYRNFSTAVILDRFLSVRNTIDLRRVQIFNARTVANSYDNNLWVFDEQEFKLKKIDDEGRLMQESADLRLVLDSVPAVTQILDQDNQVYLYDRDKGFFIFDYYGGWKNRLPLLQWEHIAISGKTLYGFSGRKMYSYALGTLDLQSFELPQSLGDFQSVCINNGKIYLLKQGGVDIYQIR